MSKNLANLGKYLWTLLKTHKKKTGAAVLVFVIFLTYRYMKKYNKLEFMIHKMNERLSKQLEENLKETQRVQSFMQNIEEIIAHFKDQNKIIKLNLKKDISFLFTIEHIKENLKLKSLSSANKKLIWENLKTEIFIHAAFALTYNNITTLILFIKETIIVKYERLMDEDRDNLVIFENFFSAFCEFIIKGGGKNLFVYLRDNLKDIYDPLSLTEKHSLSSINKIITNIKNILLQTSPNNIYKANDNANKKMNKTTPSNDALENMDLTDLSSILISQNDEKPKKSGSKSKNLEIKIPNIDLSFHLEFIKNIKNHSVLLDPQFLSKYFDQTVEDKVLSRSVGSTIHGSTDSQPLYQSEKLYSGVIDLELENQKDFLVIEEKPGKADNKVFLSHFKNAVDEFLDQIESKNFHLYLMYSIMFELKKLRNRIMLYYQKNKNEDQTLASLLMAIHKIINEEFLDPQSEKNNELFYNNRIKQALAGNNQLIVDEVELYTTHKILKEMEMKKYLERAFYEIGKRIFMEQEYAKFYDTPPQKNENKQDEMQDFLKLLTENTNKS